MKALDRTSWIIRPTSVANSRGALIVGMSVQGHATSKFVTGRQLASSSGRGWTNMLAERWSHAVGQLTPVLTRDTEIDWMGCKLIERIPGKVSGRPIVRNANRS